MEYDEPRYTDNVDTPNSPIVKTDVPVISDEIKATNHLTVQEIRNLLFCFLAWACNVSIVTLVIGTSNNVLLSIGADTRITSIPLGAFFLGSALISCGITEPLFRLAGRKNGFFVGIGLSLLASILGVLCLLFKSTALNIISTFCFGTANGIGYFLRFAVIENVPPAWAARSVTIVVSGGVIAAFAGPEAGQAMRGLFDEYDENLYYMGVFIMAGLFSVANIVCIAAVNFIPQAEVPVTNSSDERSKSNCIRESFDVYKELLCSRSFLVPMLRATIGWIVMAVPMSVLRVAMRDAGFTSRQSLLAIELHFCGMYAPGFITGNLIKYFGTRTICMVGWLVSCLAIALLLLVKTETDGTVSNWFIGMIALGIGWNFQFTGTTVWLNDAVNCVCCTKGQIQSANDFLMFLIAGAWIFSASFVYDASFLGSGVLSGWLTLNYCVVAFLVVDLLVIVVDYKFERLHRIPNQT